MKKKYYLLLFIFLFFSINVNASSYVGWEHISVSTLPEPSKETINKIYDYDNKYYITDVIVTEFEKYEVGDVFDDLYFVYPNIKNIIYDFLYENDCLTAYNCKFFDLSDNGRVSISRYQTLNDTFYFWVNSINYSLYSLTDNCTSFSNRCFIDDNTIYFNPNLSNKPIISSIPDNIFSQNAYKSIGQTKYSWKEISYYDWYELNEVESTDYYLFYTFTDISSFDVFSWVDFTTFNDFQKIAIVLMVNGFYLGFVGLCIYILLKALNKLVSWLF